MGNTATADTPRFAAASLVGLKILEFGDFSVFEFGNQDELQLTADN